MRRGLASLFRQQTVRTSLAQLDQERRPTKPEVARSNRARGTKNGCVAARSLAAACKAVSRGTRWFAQRAALDAAPAAGRRPSAASNPSAPTSHTGLAQLAERRPPKPKVRGSIPWSGASASRRSQVVEGGGLQSRRRKPASVRIGSSSPGLVSSADESGRLLPGGSAVRFGHEAPVHFPDSADGRAPGC